MTASPEKLSRFVSHALRHEPWVYELEVDGEGWVPVEALLTAIHEQGPQWSAINRDDLASMIEGSAKKRHELDGDRVRALYGHSLPGRIVKVDAEPPAALFHGTSPRAWSTIQRVGLRPMGRQYVHLSADVDTAQAVGRRKSQEPIMLVVDTRAAGEDGSRFWHGNDVIWLADRVPAGSIAVHAPEDR